MSRLRPSTIPAFVRGLVAVAALIGVAPGRSGATGSEHIERAGHQAEDHRTARCDDIGACIARFVLSLRAPSGIDKRNLEATTGLRLAASGSGIHGYSAVSDGRVQYRVEVGLQTHSAMLDVFQVEAGSGHGRCLVDFQEFARKLRGAGYAQNDIPGHPLSGRHVDFYRGKVNVYVLTRLLSPRSNRICVRRITIESGES